MKMLSVWAIRLAVLKIVPVFLRWLSNARDALDAGYEAIRLPAIVNGEQKLDEEIFAVMAENIQQRVTAAGRIMDQMLDALEGREDVLPDKWIGELEDIEEGVSNWEMDAERVVLEGRLREVSKAEEFRAEREKMQLVMEGERVAEEAREDEDAIEDVLEKVGEIERGLMEALEAQEDVQEGIEIEGHSLVADANEPEESIGLGLDKSLLRRLREVQSSEIEADRGRRWRRAGSIGSITDGVSSSPIQSPDLDCGRRRSVAEKQEEGERISFFDSNFGERLKEWGQPSSSPSSPSKGRFSPKKGSLSPKKDRSSPTIVVGGFDAPRSPRRLSWARDITQGDISASPPKVGFTSSPLALSSPFDSVSPFGLVPPTERLLPAPQLAETIPEEEPTKASAPPVTAGTSETVTKTPSSEEDVDPFMTPPLGVGELSISSPAAIVKLPGTPESVDVVTEPEPEQDDFSKDEPEGDSTESAVSVDAPVESSAIEKEVSALIAEEILDPMTDAEESKPVAVADEKPALTIEEERASTVSVDVSEETELEVNVKEDLQDSVPNRPSTPKAVEEVETPTTTIQLLQQPVAEEKEPEVLPVQSIDVTPLLAPEEENPLLVRPPPVEDSLAPFTPFSINDKVVTAKDDGTSPSSPLVPAASDPTVGNGVEATAASEVSTDVDSIATEVACDLPEEPVDASVETLAPVPVVVMKSREDLGTLEEEMEKPAVTEDIESVSVAVEDANEEKNIEWEIDVVELEKEVEFAVEAAETPIQAAEPTSGPREELEVETPTETRSDKAVEPVMEAESVIETPIQTVIEQTLEEPVVEAAAAISPNDGKVDEASATKEVEQPSSETSMIQETVQLEAVSVDAVEVPVEEPEVGTITSDIKKDDQTVEHTDIAVLENAIEETIVETIDAHVSGRETVIESIQEAVPRAAIPDVANEAATIETAQGSVTIQEEDAMETVQVPEGKEEPAIIASLAVEVKPKVIPETGAVDEAVQAVPSAADKEIATSEGEETPVVDQSIEPEIEAHTVPTEIKPATESPALPVLEENQTSAASEIASPKPTKISKVQAAKMMFETLAEGCPIPSLGNVQPTPAKELQRMRVPSPATQEIEIIPAKAVHKELAESEDSAAAVIDQTVSEIESPSGSVIYESADESDYRLPSDEDDDIVLNNAESSVERGRDRKYSNDSDDRRSDIVFNSSPPKFDIYDSPMLPSPRPIDSDYSPVTPSKGSRYLHASPPGDEEESFDYDEFDAPPVVVAAPVRPSRPSTAVATELPSIMEASTPRSMQEEWGSRASAFLSIGNKQLQASPLADRSRSIADEDGPGHRPGKYKLRGPKPARRPLQPFLAIKQATAASQSSDDSRQSSPKLPEIDGAHSLQPSTPTGSGNQSFGPDNSPAASDLSANDDPFHSGPTTPDLDTPPQQSIRIPKRRGIKAQPTMGLPRPASRQRAYEDRPWLENSVASVSDNWPSTPVRDTAAELDQKINELLMTLPQQVKLTASNLQKLNEQSNDKKGASHRPLNMSRSSIPAPKSATSERSSGASAHSRTKSRKHISQGDIQCYHLHRNDDAPPMKLYVRLVGNSRLVCRVGGGWSDLEEYLKEWALHHGSKMHAVSESKVEIQEIPNVRGVRHHSSNSSIGSRYRSPTPPNNHLRSPTPSYGSRPGSSAGRPGSSIGARPGSSMGARPGSSMGGQLGSSMARPKSSAGDYGKRNVSPALAVTARPVRQLPQRAISPAFDKTQGPSAAMRGPKTPTTTNSPRQGLTPPSHGLSPPSPDSPRNSRPASRASGYSRPQSSAGKRPASRLSFSDMDESQRPQLGLAGPHGKSKNVTPEHAAWVEGMLGQVRKASSEARGRSAIYTSDAEDEALSPESAVAPVEERRRSRSLVHKELESAPRGPGRQRGLSFGGSISVASTAGTVGEPEPLNVPRVRGGSQAPPETRRVYIKRGDGGIVRGGRRGSVSGGGNGRA
ncbi:hypothetical protein FN846DRAFT_965308 [Sphaerosporella brunnea]|uniref:GAR domain-containing protein n=1 Tax=Sphaerosporella brunnea TaxID=1250544 RepID=A0A5J5EKY4_9PEZI|nr:hypothetical protein FN846DRAFT_965308 [Sphaerosporella brunnea]